MTRILPLAVFLLVTLGLGLALLTTGAPKPPAALIGQPVPSKPIEALDHSALTKGAVIVNFFASWCVSCVEEQETLASLAKTPALHLYGVAYKDTPPATAAWLKRHGNPFAAVGRDPRGDAALDWGVYGVPETYVVIDGIVRHRHVGPLTEQAIARDILPLLSQERKDQ